jgi:hypothetical protein
VLSIPATLLCVCITIGASAGSNIDALTKQNTDLQLVNEVLQLLEVMLEVVHTGTHLIFYILAQYKHLGSMYKGSHVCFKPVSHAQHKLSSY